VAVIDVDTLDTVGTLPGELGCGAVAVGPGGRRLVVSNFMAGSVTIVDTASGEVTGRVEVGGAPCAVGVSHTLGHAFVANSVADTVTRIDIETGERLGELTTGRAPVGLLVSDDGERMYVGNRGEGTVSVIDTVSGVELTRLHVGEGPAGCVIDPVTGWLLVSNAGSNSLTVLDLGTARAASAEQHPLIGQKLPAFELPDMRSGKLRRSREWSEKLYILSFFASW
jgi:YVTN family beta-propeller protein